MVVYVLIKRYTDNSGFNVVGATDDRPIAQAFAAGGCDGAAVAEVYETDTRGPVRIDSIEPIKDWNI